MESPRFLCGQCNAGYKNKSSLRRHINVVHNQKRFVCNICSKDYSRNVDYIKSEPSALARRLDPNWSPLHEGSSYPLHQEMAAGPIGPPNFRLLIVIFHTRKSPT